LASRDLALALVARGQPLEALLQAGEHLPLAVHVAQGAALGGGLDHVTVLDLELVVDADAEARGNFHPLSVTARSVGLKPSTVLQRHGAASNRAATAARAAARAPPRPAASGAGAGSPSRVR